MQNSSGLKKSYMLAALALVLMLLSIRFAFWNTWKAWQLNKQLNSQRGYATNVNFQPGYLERKNKNLTKVVGLYQVDSLAYRNTVLTAISSLAESEKVRIIDVPTKSNNPNFQTGIYQIEKLELQGEYSSLMQFYNKLSTVTRIGVIRSAVFNYSNKEERERQKNGLRLQLYLEVIKINR